MDVGGGDGRSAVLAGARELANALKAIPAIQRVAALEERFRTDPEAQRILEELEQKVAAFRRAQEDGTVREPEVRAVREAQARFQRDPLVQDLARARQAAALVLQAANHAIGEILGLDLAGTVRPSGGCCGPTAPDRGSP